MKCLIVLIVGFGFVIGGCKKEETYNGKPMSEWIDLTKDTNYKVAEEAYAALSHMQDSKARKVFDNHFIEILDRTPDTDKDFYFTIMAEAYNTMAFRLPKDQEAKYFEKILDARIATGQADYSTADKSMVYAIQKRVEEHGVGRPRTPLITKIAKVRDLWVAGLRKENDVITYDVYLKETDKLLATMK